MKNTRWAKLACAGAIVAAAALVAVPALAAPSGWLNVDGSIRYIAANGGSMDWANVGPPGAACANGGVNVTGSGGLFNCGVPSGSNTIPPTAPALTAAAAADPSIVSSVFIVDPESGDTTACGSGDPTTTGGQNGDALSSYNISIGSVNNKTDLSNVYAVTHTRATGHPELYFGAERLVNNGESHVDFEFLQSAFSLAPCATGKGVLTGNRTEGDLLIAVDFTNGGALAGFSVLQWHCLAEPGPQPPDGTVCNPAGPEHYQLIAPPGAVSVAVNLTNIPCGGWVCRDASGVPTATVLMNDLMEGGIDLQSIGFTGCFNTFLPHTRQSAPLTAQLSDFAGPVALHTCRDQSSTSSPGGTVAPGASVRDTVTLSNGGATPPSGTVAFFLCSPAQVSGSGCSGGTQVGSAKTLAAGAATSDPSTSTTSAGKYCWRTVFTPDAGFGGIFTTTHTNATTECFNVAVAASLPDTGLPEIAANIWRPVAPALVLVALLPGLAWRRGRSIAALLIAGLVLGAGPTLSPAPAPAARDASTGPLASNPSVAAEPPPLHLATFTARAAGWRLVIPRIGVDAPIEALGRDRSGAMASPATLEGVGWFDGGPAPGQAGDAVIDGHYGGEQPAVFRKLHLLRPGDEIDVVWPDGHITYFEVSSLQTVPAASHPVGVFSRAGPARLSLITCAGAWVQSKATYSERLIVTAMLS
jgi:hypothetical protein